MKIDPKIALSFPGAKIGPLFEFEIEKGCVAEFYICSYGKVRWKWKSLQENKKEKQGGNDVGVNKFFSGGYMAEMRGFDDWALSYAPTNRRECRDAWAASAKLVEEKFTSTEDMVPCRIYQKGMGCGVGTTGMEECGDKPCLLRAQRQ